MKIKLTVSYENGEPLISDSEDPNKAVSLKQGRRAYRLAKEATEVLGKMGNDFDVPENILYAPFEFDFSGALPRYYGLNENGIDRIRLPFYAGKYPARHESGHMAHRRAIEAGGFEKVPSEKQLEALAKKDLLQCEAFADRYAGKNISLAAYGGTTAALGIADVFAVLHAPETLIWNIPLTVFIAVAAVKMAKGLSAHPAKLSSQF